MKKRLITAIPIVIMAFLIFHFSAKTGEQSTGNSIYVTEQLDLLFQGNLVESGKFSLEGLNHYIRKLAHVSEYAIFACFAVIHMFTWVEEKKRVYWLAVLISITYAATDEFHQLFVPGRSAEVRDVCIDGIGALIGAFISVVIITRMKQRRKSKHEGK